MINYSAFNRYLDPLESLFKDFPLTAFYAACGVAFNMFINDALGIFATDPVLIKALIALVVIDWVTGIMAARSRKQAITSFAMRRTVIKVVEYTVFLLAVAAVSNMDGSLAWITTWSYIFLAIVELKSVGENLFDHTGAIKGLMAGLTETIKQKHNVNIDSVRDVNIEITNHNGDKE